MKRRDPSPDRANPAGNLSASADAYRLVNYTIRNTAPEARTVILELPIDLNWQVRSDGMPADWKFTPGMKPVETTPTLARFRVVVQPGATEKFHASLVRRVAEDFELIGMSDTQFRLMITNNANRPAVEKALAPVIAARAKLHDFEMQLAQEQQAIDRLVDDQKRLRENLKDLKDSPEERALAAAMPAK